ncbi:MAG TPA: pyridoxal-phosphate dependent enzyme [Microthrixaceae bacterium]|nr:pyridoxal-phosphate dependent enzyme [Microthrixaceae bacterium]
MSGVPTFDDVRAAAARIEPLVHRTPVMTSRLIDEIVGTRVHFKCEHLQRAGAFKFRGATNAVQSLSDEAASRGVVTHSSGNHGAALALAAGTRGVTCRVVMPADAPAAKFAATRGYGAVVVECEPTMAARAAGVAEIVAATGAAEIHPFNHPDVMAGQGTAALELLETMPALRTIVAPVSGGGLMSGTAIAAHGIDPSIRLVGAEPAAVDDAARSIAAGELRVEGNGTTIADGLVATLSETTLGVLLAHEVEVVTVSEAEIVAAMALVFTRLKQVVEPSGATAVASLLALARRKTVDGPVGVILSGGNVDLDALPF